MGRDISTLFVYGTLQPGDVRWPYLEPFAADGGTPDTVDGQLFDTGCGYPAALLDHRATPGNTIRGRRFALRADRIDEALAVLDTRRAASPACTDASASPPTPACPPGRTSTATA